MNKTLTESNLTVNGITEAGQALGEACARFQNTQYCGENDSNNSDNSDNSIAPPKRQVLPLTAADALAAFDRDTLIQEVAHQVRLVALGKKPGTIVITFDAVNQQYRNVSDRRAFNAWAGLPMIRATVIGSSIAMPLRESDKSEFGLNDKQTIVDFRARAAMMTAWTKQILESGYNPDAMRDTTLCEPEDGYLADPGVYCVDIEFHGLPIGVIYVAVASANNAGNDAGSNSDAQMAKAGGAVIEDWFNALPNMTAERREFD